MRFWIERYKTADTDYAHWDMDKVCCALCQIRFVLKDTIAYAYSDPNYTLADYPVEMMERYKDSPYRHQVGAICNVCSSLSETQLRGFLEVLGNQDVSEARTRELGIENALPLVIAVQGDLIGRQRLESELAEIENQHTFALAYIETLKKSGNILISIAQKGDVRVAKPETKQAPSQFGYVYLLGSPDGYCKIGRAKHLSSRLLSIGLQLPYRVEMLHSIPVSDPVWAERELHKKFASCRMNGEWFLLADADIQWIKSLDILEP